MRNWKKSTPTGGTGSSLVAAKELNRNYIGFEIDKQYFDITNKRLKNIEK